MSVMQAIFSAREEGTYRRRRDTEKDGAIEERLVSVDDKPDSESKADGEEPDGVYEPAFVIIVVVYFPIVTHVEHGKGLERIERRGGEQT